MSQTLDIALVVPGLSFDGDTLKEKGLGGSETAAIYMAKELVACGNRVTVFSKIPEPKVCDGVQYIPIELAQQYTRNIPHDVTIVQRQPEYFTMPTNSKLNILWVHDLAFKRNEQTLKSPLWNIDKIFAVSNYHVKQWCDVYELTDQDKIFYATRNGIDTDLINSIRDKNLPRDPFRLVYAARPERGLDLLIDSIFEKILQIEPRCTLVVPTYDVGLPELQNTYNAMYSEAKRKFGDKFNAVGSLKKEELYQLYCTSGAYIYPTPGKMDPKFREVSCISAMEAMACGLPIVTSAQGALSETVKPGAGILLSGDPTSNQYAIQFAESVKIVLNEPRFSRVGLTHAKNLSWKAVAEDWSSKFVEMIKANNKDPVRLFIDLWRNSDIIAAKTLIDEVPDYLEAKKDILTNFDFVETGKFAEHYEKWNAEFHPGVVEQAKHQHRYKLLEQWAKQVNPHTVLDYACHDGAYTTNLAKVMPGTTFIGVDFNSKAIEAGIEFSADTKNVRYMMVEDMKEYQPKRPSFDCLLMQEVLEHVTEPWKLVDEQEKYLEDGANVYITVPFGPWEYDTVHENACRAHLWHFDRHDLFDMFKDKADLSIGGSYHGDCNVLPVPRGWWVVTYKKNGKPTNKINMDRKLWLQRPRQTVSLNVMAGPGSGEQSRWMLNSTKHIVDQYVVVDTGMGVSDLQPWVDLGNALILKGPDPKIHGFETPRNIGLQHCEMDFVMWLDTDERLCDPLNTIKYLRQNCFEGYGIRQHHFAIDAPFPPDMPVRLFRNKERNDGKKMQWVGMIHEHPETGVNEGPGFVVVIHDVNIAHTGYLTESVRRNRFFRNLAMLNKDAQVYPTRKLGKHFIMRDSIQLAMYQLQSNGGRLTPDIVNLCRDTIKLYQENFLGGSVYHAIDSQTWYSRALEILGEGFWVDYSLATGDQNVQSQSTKRKYATAEDFKKDFNSKVEAELSKFKCEFQ